MKPRDKERVVVETVERVLRDSCATPLSAEQALLDTIYHEKGRLEKERDKELCRVGREFYERIQREAIKGGPDKCRDLLREVVRRFADEVVGHFDYRVFRLATSVVPPALQILLNALSPLRLIDTIQGGPGRLEDHVDLQGDIDSLKVLSRRGTIVMVPTHISNLDSILLGYAIERMGLPPFTYGAGVNLFENKLIGFFMHNLGAYKVDRRKKAPVYKEVLKAYAGVTMEHGYHNLFFPGGTRSRSGAVERQLKLGLLSMSLSAYINNLRAQKSRPDIFVVPCTINYQLVLEAETLIDDHLKDVGKSRYIIDDDEFSRPKVVLDFVSKLFSLNSRIRLVFSSPLDVFGNRVCSDGTSIDARGRPIDRRRYVMVNGRPDFERQRDEEYTRELAQSVVDSFHRDTIISATNLLSETAISLLKENNQGMDLYRLLRTGGNTQSLSLVDVYARLEQNLNKLRDLENKGRLRLAPTLQTGDCGAIVGKALSHLGSFHLRPAVVRRGDRLFHVDTNLLLYYGSRLGRHQSWGEVA